MANTVYQPTQIKVKIKSDGGLQATTPVTLKNVAQSVTNLTNLYDVNITDAANNDILTYSNGASQWVNRAAPTLTGNGQQIAVTNTSPFDYQLAFPNSITVSNNLVVGSGFQVNNGVTYIDNGVFGNVSVTNVASIANTLTVRDIIPAANNTYTIGTPGMRFTDLYLSGNTLTVGNVVFNDENTALAIDDPVGNPIPLFVGNTTVTGDLDVSNEFSANSLAANTLLVYQSSNLAGNVAVGGTFAVTNTIATGNSTVTGFINVTSTANIGGAVTARANVTVNGAVVVANTIATGNSTITGFINVSSTANIGGDVNARANVTVNGAVVVANVISTGNSTITGFINVSSTANVGGVANFRANVVANGQLIVSNTAALGNTTVTGFINVSSSANVGGAVNVNGALTVTNTAAVGNTTVTGFINVSSTANVGGVANFRANVVANGQLIVSNVASIGNTTITGFANVVGNVAVSDTIAGNNMTLSGNLTVSGTTTYINTTNLNIGDNVIVLNADLGAVAPTEKAGIEVNRGTSSNVEFVWNESFGQWTTSGDPFAAGAVYTGNVATTGYINVSSTANIGGDITARANVTVNGAVVVANTLATGNTTVTGFINVSSTAALGNTTINGFANITGGVTVTGDITANQVTLTGTSGNGGVVLTDTSITSWNYTGKSFSTAGQETAPTGIEFKPDGTKMYLVGQTGDAVHEYNLGTAWDVTTATFVQSFSILAQDTTSTEISFSADGTKMYVLGDTINGVLQYNLGTAWNVSTATYIQQFSTASQETGPNGLFVKSDGTTFWVVGSGTDTVFEYTMSTPWDLSTSSYSTRSFAIGSQEGTSTGVSFSSDGTNMFVVGTTTDRIYHYTLATPWNVTTATLVGSVTVLMLNTTPNGIYYSDTAGRVWVVDSSSDAVFELTTNLPGLQITANTVAFSNTVRVGNTIHVAKDSFVQGNQIIVGNQTVTGTSTLGTTTIGGTLTATSTLTLAGSTTSTTSLGTNATSGTTTIGGTTQTGAITVGQSTTNQTLNMATGATTSANTKTVNIGTAGLSGSITNINLGSSVAGATGNTTVNSLNLVAAGNVVVTGQTSISNTLSAGNTTIGGTAWILVGNSTVNVFANSSLVRVVNSTASANLSPIGLVTGIVTANATTVAVGSNVYANATNIYVGNSTQQTVVGNGLVVVAQSHTGQVTIGNDVNGGIELGQPGRATVGTPFVDFHSSTNNIDYDSRIIAAGGNSTIGSGNLQVVASNFNIANTTVTGFVNVSSTANVGGEITARANVTVNGAFVVANTAAIGNTTVTGFINVSSTANVGGAVTARGDVTVNGALTVANTAALGNTTITGFINVSSTANIGGAVTARGDVTVNGALTVANNATITGYANVTTSVNSAILSVGTSFVANSTGVTSTGFANVAGKISGRLGGADANVAGGIGLDINSAVIRVGDGLSSLTMANGTGIKIHDSGNSHKSVGQLGNTFIIAETGSDGNSLFPATRTDLITANTSLIGLNVNTAVTGYINVTSTANIGGDLTARANVTVNGAVVIANTLATGNTTVTGFINVSSTANVGGAINARSDLTVNGALVVSNTASLGNTTITGFANVSGNLTANNIRTIGDLQIDGNFYVNGNTVTIGVTNLGVQDNMLYLNEPESGTITGATSNGSAFIYAANNTLTVGMVVDVTGMSPTGYNLSANAITFANTTHFAVANTTSPGAYVSGGSYAARVGVNPDLGFAGNYNDGTYRHAGFFRDATDGVWKVFDQYVPEPSGAFIDTANNTFRIADFQANNTTLGGLTVTTANTYLGGASGSEGLRVVPQAGANRPFVIQGGVSGSLGARIGVTSEAIDYYTSGGYAHFFATNGPRSAIQFAVNHVGSAVNYIQAVGSATGTAVALSAQGSDTNVDFSVNSKGTGEVSFFTRGAKQAVVTGQSSAVNYLVFAGQTTGNYPNISVVGSDSNIGLDLFSKGTGPVRVRTGSGSVVQFQVADTASAVNYLIAQGGATGGRVAISAAGTDADVGINYIAKGAGLHVFAGQSGTTQFVINPVASAVNYFQAQGAATGNQPFMVAAGSDTNIALGFTSKGNGNVNFYTNGGAAQQFAIAHTSTSVNYIQATGSATGSAVVISAQGTDTNVAFNVQSKGSGDVNLSAGNGGWVSLNPGGVRQVAARYIASAVNYMTLWGSASGGNAVTLSAAYAADTNVDVNIAAKAAGAINLQTSGLSTGGTTQFRVADTASAVNYVQVTGAATGNTPTISSQGSDTNINLFHTTKGTGSHVFYTNAGVSGRQFDVVHTASAVNRMTVTGSATGAAPTLSVAGGDTNIGIQFQTKGTGGHTFQTNSNVTQFTIADVTSAVNYIQASGGATGAGTGFLFTGSDAAVVGTYNTKGAGAHAFYTNNNAQFRVADTASAVNYIQVTGSGTGASPVISAQGSDSVISLSLRSKGTGSNITPQFDGSTYFQNLSGANQLRVYNTASAVNYLQITGSTTGNDPWFAATGSDANVGMRLSTRGAGAFTFQTGGGSEVTQMTIAHVAGANRYLQVQGGVSGTSSPAIGAVGGTSFNIYSTGGANIDLWTNGLGTNRALSVVHAASAVNYVQVSGAATGAGATVSANGSDTNIALNIAAKASANVNINSNTNFAANTLSFTGSAGSNTNIALRVLNDGVLSFEGGAGQLFSIANSLTGQIFSVNDISGIPSIEVYSNGQVNIAKFGGNVSIGTSTSTVTVNGAVTFANAVTLANNISVTGYVNATASVNSAVLSVGTSVIANTSGITTTGYANVGTTVSVGANIIANTSALFIGNSTVNTIVTQTTAAFNANSTATALYVAANGNVGISNATPNAKLQVTGTANISGNVALGGDLTVAGNLTVSGTTTYINTTTLNVGDNIITLNADLGAVAPSENAGFEVNRGTSANVSFIWDETNDRFVASNANNGLQALATEYSVTLLPTDGSGPRVGFGNLTTTNAYMEIGSFGSSLNNIDNKTRNLSIYSSTSNIAFFAANGNVGIGNTTPTSALQVTTTATAAAGATIARFGTSSDAGRIRIIDENSTGSLPPMITSPSAAYGLGIAADHSGGAAPIRFYLGGTANTTNEKVTFAANGNVGIGNTTPTNKLVVAGTTQITSGDLRIANGYLYFDANTTPTISKASGNTSQSIRMEIANLGGNSTVSAGAWWNGLHFTGPTGFANSTGGATFPRTSAYFSYTSNNNPSDLYFNLQNGNNGGAGGVDVGMKLYAIAGSDGATRGIDISANGNVGIGNTTPGEKLVVAGNIFANNLRKYNVHRTLSTTVNDTIEIGTFANPSGGHNLTIAIHVSDSSFSVAKQYQIASLFNSTGSTYKKVIPTFDTGPYATNDFDLEAYHNNDTIGLRLRRTGGSTAGTAIIDIEDMSIEETDTDSFTSSSTTATGVAAVTDFFPSNRLVQTGAGASVANAFIVIANTSVNAMTSNNTQTVFNLPVSFTNYTTLGSTGQASISLTTSATTANQVITHVTLGASVWRTLKYLVQVTSGSAYQATEITLIHDGTNVYKSEYGQVFSGAVLATFDADISGGNIRLLTTPTNAVTVYKGMVTFVAV